MIFACDETPANSDIWAKHPLCAMTGQYRADPAYAQN